MKYKFIVTYSIDESKDAQVFTSTIELIHTDGTSIEQVKDNITFAFKKDGYKVISIEGGIVE